MASRLLIRPGAIGDLILALPALEFSRAEHTEVWAPRPVLPLMRFADRVRAIADTGLDLLGVIEGARVPELERFGSIYSWYGANRPEFREAVRDLPFQFFPALPDGGVHAADFFLLQVGGAPPAAPRLNCPRAAEDFAVIHPFSGSTTKNWPLENYRAVARRLGMPVRWCVGPEEALEDALRIDDLWELARWVARCRVYAGNDSGITHLAAAAGAPVVAIFVATDPVVWGPRGEGAVILENPAVDEVVDAIHRVARRAGEQPVRPGDRAG